MVGPTSPFVTDDTAIARHGYSTTYEPTKYWKSSKKKKPDWSLSKQENCLAWNSLQITPWSKHSPITATTSRARAGNLGKTWAHQQKQPKLGSNGRQPPCHKAADVKEQKKKACRGEHGGREEGTGAAAAAHAAVSWAVSSHTKRLSPSLHTKPPHFCLSSWSLLTLVGLIAS